MALLHLTREMNFEPLPRYYLRLLSTVTSTPASLSQHLLDACLISSWRCHPPARTPEASNLDPHLCDRGPGMRAVTQASPGVSRKLSSRDLNQHSGVWGQYLKQQLNPSHHGASPTQKSTPTFNQKPLETHGHLAAAFILTHSALVIAAVFIKGCSF